MEWIINSRLPNIVTAKNVWGRPQYTLNILAEQQGDEWRWMAVQLPVGGLSYDVIVDAIITAKYPNDKMQAVINNYLLDMGNPTSMAEFSEMQQWRSKAKQVAVEVLAYAEENGLELLTEEENEDNQ